METKMKDWFAARTTWQKVALVVFLWPYMAAWWFWTNPQFSTKTKAVVTAVGVVVIGVMSVFGEPVSDVSTDVTTAESEVEASTTTTTRAIDNRRTSIGVTCGELDGMINQAWLAGNDGLTDAWYSVSKWECY
jgi:hypothetical protein